MNQKMDASTHSTPTPMAAMMPKNTSQNKAYPTAPGNHPTLFECDSAIAFSLPEAYPSDPEKAKTR